MRPGKPFLFGTSHEPKSRGVITRALPLNFRLPDLDQSTSAWRHE
jgi:hypothetical protein